MTYNWLCNIPVINNTSYHKCDIKDCLRDGDSQSSSVKWGEVKSYMPFLPIVEYLWDLPPGVVCTITTERARAVCEQGAIWTLHFGHSSITV